MNYICQTCGIQFKRMSSYELHKDICWDKMFNEKTKLDTPMNIKCHDCKINFVTMQDFQQHLCRMKQEPKMTREEAIELSRTYGNKYPWYEDNIRSLEALGLLKFDEDVAISRLDSATGRKEEINKLFEINERGINFSGARTLDYQKFNEQYGYIRLELWPEGLALWVGGCIVWKSWEKYYQTGDDVTVINRTNKLTSCGKIT